MSEDVATIAKGLTPAQRSLLLDAPRTASDSWRPACRLAALGLADWKRRVYGDKFFLTPLGLRVRQHLLDAALAPREG